MRRRSLALLALLAAALPGAVSAEDGGLERIDRALRGGNARAAVQELETRLRADPKDGPALRALGIVKLKLGEVAEAQRLLTAARDAGVPEPDLAVPLAQALMLQDRADALLIAIPPGDRPAAIEGEVRFWRGLALAALEDLAASLVSLEEAARLLPDDPRPDLARAQQLTALRRLPEAEAAAAEALRRAHDPAQRAEALALSGELRRMAGDNPAASRLFAEALLTDPDASSALLGRATLAMSEGKTEEAERDARRILDATPDHPAARYLVAAAQAARNQLTAALATLHDAEQKAYPPALLLRATLRLNRGELELARQDLDQYQSVAGRDARSQRLRGALLLRLHEPELAVKALEDAAAGEPGDIQTAALLAAAHLLAGDFAAAAGSLDSRTGMEAVRELSRQMPGSPLPPTLAGTVLAARRDGAARSWFELALRKDPRFIPALLGLGRLDQLENDTESARRRFQAVLELDPRHAGAMTALAELDLRDDKPDSARQWLDRAIAGDPDSVPPRLARIDLLLRDGEASAALAAARQLAGQAPREPAVLEALGKAEWAAGARPASLATFRRLAEVMPRAVKAHMLLASALSAAGDAEGAVRAADTAVGLAESHLPAQAQRLQLLVAAGRGDEAVAAAQAWRDRYPGQTAGEILLADVHLRLGRPAEGAAVLAQAFARQPTTPLAIRLAEARLRAGAADQAAAGLADWVAGHPDETAARSALAALHLRAGRFTQAQAEFEAVVRADTGNAVAFNNLAWLYDRGDDPRALAMAEEAYRLSPDSPQVADTLGAILVRRNETERGLRLLRQAHAAAPQAPEIRYHLAAALAQAGEVEEARRLLDALVSENVQFEEATAAKELRDSLAGGG